MLGYLSLIRSIFETQEGYYTYSEGDIDWFRSVTLDFLDRNYGTLFLNSLAHLTRNEKGGKYSLLFNQNVYRAIKSRNESALKETMLAPKEYKSLLVMEYCEYLDRYEHEASIPLNKDLTEPVVVALEEKDDIWLIRRFDLIFCLLAGNYNPLSQREFERFSELKDRYSASITKCSEEHEKGYSHIYGF